MEQIKIISDGDTLNCKILNSDGKQIPGITKCVIVMLPNSLVTAELTFDNVALDIVARADLPEITENDGSE